MTETAAEAQIFAVMLGLRDDALLLPNIGIVEIISRDGLQTKPSAAAWFAGTIDWHGNALPVIRFEALGGKSADEIARRARIAVVRSVGTQLPGGRFGVLCEGYPHLVTLDRQSMRAIDARAEDREGFVLARVRVGGAEAAIPNLERIEAVLAAALDSAIA